MLRFIDLSPTAFPSLEGDIRKSVDPGMGASAIDPSSHVEAYSSWKSVGDILGYLSMNPFRVGAYPHDIMHYVTMTTKPHGTHASCCIEPVNRDGGRDFSTIPINDQIGRGVVLDLTPLKPGSQIAASDLDSTGVKPCKGDVVLIRTDYSDEHRQEYPSPEYLGNSPTLTTDAARWLIDKGVKIVAVDFPRIDEYPASTATSPAETARGLIYSANVIVIEDLVSVGRIPKASHPLVICAFPLKIRGLCRGPARVVAIDHPGGASPTLVDLTTRMRAYPDPEPPRPPYQAEPPLPQRIEPIEMRAEVVKWSRISPFRLRHQANGESREVGCEAYLWFSEQCVSHVEFSYFDPFPDWKISEDTRSKYNEIPLEKVVGTSSVVKLDAGPGQLIDAPQLEQNGRHVNPGDIVLLKTGFDDMYFNTPVNLKYTPGLTLAASEWLVDKGIKTLAVDFPSVETQTAFGVPTATIHSYLWKHDVPIVEYVANTHLLRKDRFYGAFLPLSVRGLPGFALRAIAIEEW